MSKSKIFYFKNDGSCGGSDFYIGSVTVRLDTSKKGKPVFTAFCGVHYKDGNLNCGQCFGEFLKVDTLSDKELFMTIYGLWQRNHLNDMHAGTERQEAEIEAWMKRKHAKYDFGKACDHLKKVGLYEDNGYCYGSKWLYREISPDDMETIRKLLEIK